MTKTEIIKKESGMKFEFDKVFRRMMEEHQLDTVEPTINREDLRRIFLDIYANPVITKEFIEAPWKDIPKNVYEKYSISSWLNSVFE